MQTQSQLCPILFGHTLDIVAVKAMQSISTPLRTQCFCSPMVQTQLSWSLILPHPSQNMSLASPIFLGTLYDQTESFLSNLARPHLRPPSCGGQPKSGVSTIPEVIVHAPAFLVVFVRWKQFTHKMAWLKAIPDNLYLHWNSPASVCFR